MEVELYREMSNTEIDLQELLKRINSRGTGVLKLPLL